MSEWLQKGVDVYSLIGDDGADLGMVTPNRGRWFAWKRISGHLESFTEYDFRLRSDAQEALEGFVKARSVTTVQAMPVAAAAPAQEHPPECPCEACNLRRFAQRHEEPPKGPTAEDEAELAAIFDRSRVTNTE